MPALAKQLGDTLLTVTKLNISYAGEEMTVHAVRDLSFELAPGETLGIVGESGSGKTQTALALMGLLPQQAAISGSAVFQGQELLSLNERARNQLRGNAMSMIFQDPMTALNPHLTIGRQMSRVLERHQHLSRKDALQAAADMLDAVRVPDAKARIKQYPHEMSGGMRQRIMIATALLCKPDLLLADEPTTALDVTVQAQILTILRDLQRDLGTAIVLITHDMGVVAGNCDRVLVMREGSLRESGAVDDVFYQPKDAYTRELLAAVPRLDGKQTQRLAVVAATSDTAVGAALNDAGFSGGKKPTENPKAEVTSKNLQNSEIAAMESPAAKIRTIWNDDSFLGVREPPENLIANSTVQESDPEVTPPSEPLLTVDDLHVAFPAGAAHWFGKQRKLRAVDGVSFSLARGETLGVVGESGCGKSTLARAILQLLDNYQGRVCLMGADLARLKPAELLGRRQQMQVVFQDPLAALNPRMTVGDIVGEPLLTFYPELTRAGRLEKVFSILQRVGLKPDHVNRYPHEFSGGQCQRIGIARALMVEPELIICDEPVSALDVSVQAQVINLLMDLQRDMGLALIFIAHDLAVVRHISHRVMVMYLGRIVEIADRNSLYEAPQHPYTRALISAVPIPDPRIERARERLLLQGDLPSPLDPLSGCAFRTRCPLADALCAAERPELRAVGASLVACHHA